MASAALPPRSSAATPARVAFASEVTTTPPFPLTIRSLTACSEGSGSGDAGPCAVVAAELASVRVGVTEIAPDGGCAARTAMPARWFDPPDAVLADPLPERAGP